MQNNLKRRVLLVLPGNSLQVWSDTGIIQNMTRTCDLFILTWNQAKSTSIPTFKKEVQIKQISTPIDSRITILLQEMSLIVYRSRSQSFQLMFERLLFGETLLSSLSIKSLTELKIIIRRVFAAIKYLFYPGHRVISLIPGINLITLNLLNWVFQRKDSHLLDQLSFCPELLITPSSGVEPYVYELIRDAHKLKIKTAMVIHNWDNLTSKSVIVVKPDFITVMGNSSVEKARRIQMLDSTIILPAGLPRHNLLRQYKLSPKKSRPPDSSFVIKYLGFSSPHNEIDLINAVVGLLKKINFPEPWRFIYRPHPARQARFRESIKIDSRIIVHKSDSLQFQNFSKLPMIDEIYLNNLEEADVIISTPTTMAIEAMLLNKIVLIDGTSDGTHRTSAGYALNRYEHLEDLRNIKNLMICKSAQEIVTAIVELNNQKKLISYDIGFLVENSEPCFSIHLNKLLSFMND
jgi:hypothetical protein